MRCLVKIFLSEQRLETSAINSEVSSTLMQNTSIPSHRSRTLVHDAGNVPDPRTRKSGTPQRLLPDCRYTRYTALCNYNDNYFLGKRSDRSNEILLPHNYTRQSTYYKSRHNRRQEGSPEGMNPVVKAT